MARSPKTLFNRYLLYIFLLFLQTGCDQQITNFVAASVRSGHLNEIAPSASTSEYSIKPLFPLGNSLTGAQLTSLVFSFEVTNTAGGDLSKVDQVLVNGTAATLRTGSAKTYEVSVPLNVNANSIQVNVVEKNSVAGSLSLEVTNVALTEQTSPTEIAVNAAGTKAYLAGNSSQLIESDLVTGARRVVSDSTSGIGSGPAFSGVEALAVNAAGSAVYVAGSMVGIVKIDLSTGDRTMVSESGSVGAGSGFVWPSGMVLNAAGTKAYISDYVTNSIFEIDLATGDRTVKSSSTNMFAIPLVGTGPDLAYLKKIALSSDEMTLYTSSWLDQNVLSINIATGNRTVISAASDGLVPSIDSARGLALSADQTKIYATSNTSVLSINIATGARATVSRSDVGGGPLLYATAGLKLDASGSNAYVVDGTYPEAILKVDLSSGARTILKEKSIGSGYELGGAFGTYFSSIKTDLFVVSSKGVYKLNTLTGARSVLSDPSVGTGPNFILLVDFAINTSETVAYVLDSGSSSVNGVMRVDLLTGVRTIVSNGSIGSGPAIPASVSGMVVNNDETYGYYSTVSPAAIYKVNLSTGARTVVSDGSTGTGTVFSAVSSIALDSSGTRIFAADNSRSSLFVVDIATGNRVEVSRSAIGATIGTGPAYSAINSIILSSTAQTAYVSTSTSILLVDLVNGNRTLVAGPSLGVGPTTYFGKIKNLAPSDKVFSAASNTVFEINLLNGDRLIRSR